MLTLKCRLFLLLVAVFAISCSSSSHKRITEWSAVAVVGATNPTAQEMVRSTLKKHNIVCFMEGSVIFTVMVPKGRLDEAKSALLENPGLRRPLIIILEDGIIPGFNETEHTK
jgi:hypothetical protein